MNTKPAYQFNQAGLYMGETVADESPLEPGVFLLPAGCTLIEPPEAWPDTKWPRFNGRKWTLVKKPALPTASEITPEEKLRQFLIDNPDVAKLVS